MRHLQDPGCILAPSWNCGEARGKGCVRMTIAGQHLSPTFFSLGTLRPTLPTF